MGLFGRFPPRVVTMAPMIQVRRKVQRAQMRRVVMSRATEVKMMRDARVCRSRHSLQRGWDEPGRRRLSAAIPMENEDSGPHRFTLIT